MKQTTTMPEVLTLAEAARFLRLSPGKVEQLAVQGRLPGRQIGRQWRFLKAALSDWLRGGNGRDALLALAGSFSDDETLPALRAEVYRKRGRPEAE